MIVCSIDYDLMKVIYASAGMKAFILRGRMTPAETKDI